MKLSIKEARTIKNIIAREIYDIARMNNGIESAEMTKDKDLWQHCDINQRFSLKIVIDKIRKI